MTRPELIYLACPYSHKDVAVRIARFEAANRTAGKLIANGNHVFSPISHTHPIEMAAEGKLPMGWEYWAAYDERMIGYCDRLIVLAIDGWTQSTGVQAEITIARKLGIPVDYLTPNE
jgi:hypothetical protein